MTEPRPALPLDYEPERPRRGPWTLVLALVAVALALAAVAIVFLGIGFTRTTTVAGPVIVATPAVPGVPAAGQDQMRSVLVPEEGLEVTLKQRESRWLAGGRLKLWIDDITGGQVLVSISDDAGNVLLGPKSVREGDVLNFADPEGATLRLEVLKLTNLLIGDDFGEFLLLPADAAGEPAEDVGPE